MPKSLSALFAGLCICLVATPLWAKKKNYEISLPNIRTERFPDTGEIKAEGAVTLSCQDNCSKSDIKNLSESEIKKLPKNGSWKLYVQKTRSGSNEKYSVLNSSGEYKNNSKEGIWIFYYDSGETLKETTFANGIKEGTEKKFSKSGSQTQQTSYKNNKREGESWKKNKDGQLLEEGVYKDDKKEGAWKTFYAENNGAKKTEEFYSKDIKTGQFKSFHKNGNVAAEGMYANGLRTGKWVFYHDNGKINAEGVFKAQPAPEQKEEKKEEWEQTETDPEEPVKKELKALRSGIWKEYYKSGVLFSSGMRNHSKTGIWNFYDNTGKLRFSGEMANDVMLKSATIYDENGVILGKGKLLMSLIKIDETDNLKATYKPGAPFVYYKNGKKSFEVLSSGNSGATIAVEYDDNGNKKGQGPIAAGTTKKNGCWSEDGKKVYYMMGKQNQKFAPMQGCK